MTKTRIQEITDELNRLRKVAEGLSLRYQAHLNLHTAAAMAVNEDELQERRDDCHTVLDAILDNGEAVHRLIAEQVRLTSGPA